MAVSWAYGVFLGMDSRDNTHRICDDGRLESARDLEGDGEGRGCERHLRKRLQTQRMCKFGLEKKFRGSSGSQGPSPPLYANYI